MHKVLVNRLGGLSLPMKSVVRLTDCPDMTLDVYPGHKTTIQQQQIAGKPNPSKDRSVPKGIYQCFLMCKFVPLRSDPPLRRETKMKLAELLSLNVNPFTLKHPQAALAH